MVMSECSSRLRGRLVVTVLLLVLTSTAVVDAASSQRRTARRLDRALIHADKAIIQLGLERVRGTRRQLLRARKRIRRNLDDPDIAAADADLAAAVDVVRSPGFSPPDDGPAVAAMADAAAVRILNSATFLDTHEDGIVYLGRTGKFRRYRFTLREFFPLGVSGPFEILRLEPVGASIVIDDIRVFFEPGDVVDFQRKRAIDRVRKGDRRRFELVGRFVDFLLIDAFSDDVEDRARLKFWGFLDAAALQAMRENLETR